LQMESFRLKAVRYHASRERENRRGAARAGAVILKRWLAQPALPKNARVQVAYGSLHFSLLLRWGKAAEEALPLVELATRTLQELHDEDPSGYLYLAVLGNCRVEVGKVHWELSHAEETLTAFRQALE